MGKLFYDIFLAVYSISFRIAALFNRKARLGISGRKKGYYAIKPRSAPLIWMHCASLGEFEQGRPVLELLKKQYPGVLIALSFFSASGYEAMKNYEGADQVFYLPMDGASNAKKLVDVLNPSLVLWVKYEFWYYYLHELKCRHIPVLLVSAIFRSSHPYFKWYGGIWRQMLGCFTHLFVQNETSVSLLAAAGIHENVTISGDTRFDRVIGIAAQFEPLPVIAKFCAGSKTIVAGSTWEDDESELIHYVRANPQIKFIIAPHETDTENLKDVQKEFKNSIFYSDLPAAGIDQPTTNNNPPQSHNVLIIDNVGMLSRLYRYADITYVGGGFGADGVHNVLEAAVYAKPVVFGPEYEKYREATELVECGAGISVQNALELETVLDGLWKDTNLLAEKGEAASKYVYSNAGASNKVIAFIHEKRLLTS